MDLRNFDPSFATSLSNFVGDFPSLGINVVPTSGYRDNALQSQLYDSYLSGTGGLAAPPGGSYHNYGLAADFSPNYAAGGTMQDIYRMDAAAPAYGLTGIGGRDPGHIEMGASALQVDNPDATQSLSSFRQAGFTAGPGGAGLDGSSDPNADAFGGSASNPLPTLTAADYGGNDAPSPAPHLGGGDPYGAGNYSPPAVTTVSPGDPNFDPSWNAGQPYTTPMVVTATPSTVDKAVQGDVAGDTFTQPDQAGKDISGSPVSSKAVIAGSQDIAQGVGQAITSAGNAATAAQGQEVSGFLATLANLFGRFVFVALGIAIILVALFLFGRHDTAGKTVRAVGAAA